MLRAFSAVAVLALACLSIRADRVGMAGAYVDPIGRITAQDEALYAHSAIQMARNGHWLTPMFMGRFALYKPPLLIWLAGISARVAGISRFALRFPVVLICSLAAGLIFLWASEAACWQAGVLAAALLLSSHLWHVLASLCMTDGLLVAFFVAALYALFSDPWLQSKTGLWMFSGSVAAATLTKSVAGLLPLAVLGLYWLTAPPKYKPSFRRLCQAGLLAAALAAPWYCYQLIAHGRWFWAEHVGVEILGYGGGAPAQTSGDSHLLFYLTRLFWTDPVLVAAMLFALPGLFAELRRRSPAAVLLACWIAVVLLSVFTWQYRNASYLLPLLPALAILASSYGPVSRIQPAAWILILAAAAVLWKSMLPAAPWGMSFAAGTVQKVAPIAAGYCQLLRSNELILAGMDDDLYASILPLPRLRYALEGHPPAGGAYFMSFSEMGIILTAEQFDHLDRWRPIFRQRLRAWGLDSDSPIGTVVMAASPAEFGAMVQAHPGSDFLFPDRYRQAVAPLAATSHVLVEASPDHFLLLSREGRKRSEPPGWPCRM